MGAEPGIGHRLCFAGFPAAVGSLWKVDDASTATLMKQLYDRLPASEGHDKARALNDARRALRETHEDPYYWAAFVFLGDPRWARACAHNSRLSHTSKSIWSMRERAIVAIGRAGRNAGDDSRRDGACARG